MDFTCLPICPHGRSPWLSLFQPQVARTEAALADALGLSEADRKLTSSRRGSLFYFVIGVGAAAETPWFWNIPCRECGSFP